jgi:hypothetical protein
MIVLGPIFAVAALWLMGALTLSLMGARRHSGIDVLVLDFAAGVVVLAAFGMTTLALGWRLSPLPIYAILAILTIAALWRGRSIRLSIRPPRDTRARTLLIVAGGLLLILAISAGQDRLVWDGWAFWTLKARILFLEGSFPAAVLDPAGPYPYAHPDYPLAVPLLDWWLYWHAGRAAPALASLAGALWFATLPACVWAALHPRVGETVAALATLGTTAFWPLAFYAAGGYADVVIALAILGVVLELERDRGERDPGAPARLAVYLTLAALAKNEGLALAAVTTLVAAIVWRRDKRRAHSFATLVIPFLASAPWFLLTRRLGLTPQHLSDAAPTISGAIARIPTILTSLGKLFFTRSWIPLPFLVSVGLYAAIQQRRLAAPAGWAVVAGYAAVICGVYLTTALELEWLLRTTIDRMAGDLVPAIVVLALVEIWTERSGTVSLHAVAPSAGTAAITT